MSWRPNRFDNKRLNHQQADGIAADIREARAALDRLEAACRAGEHPNRLKDFINSVTGMMSFATAFCNQAAIHCEQRREKEERIRSRSESNKVKPGSTGQIPA